MLPNETNMLLYNCKQLFAALQCAAALEIAKG